MPTGYIEDEYIEPILLRNQLFNTYKKFKENHTKTESIILTQIIFCCIGPYNVLFLDKIDELEYFWRGDVPNE